MKPMWYDEDVYTYYWMHTPTGEKGTATKTLAEIQKETHHISATPIEKLSWLLNNWNRLGNGMWVYWI